MELKNCPTYLGYSITEDGRLFTHRQRFGLGKGKGGGVKINLEHKKELNSFEGHGGYLYYSVSTVKGQRTIPTHTLLLDAFVGPRPKNMETRHLDGNPKNNDLTNLVYGTAQENADDRKGHGMNRKGSNHPRSKLSENIVGRVRKQYKDGWAIAALARLHKVSESTMRNAIIGKTWSHI